MIGYKPDEKTLGKRSALNAHAAFDEAGGGNIDLNLMRHCSTLRASREGGHIQWVQVPSEQKSKFCS